MDLISYSIYILVLFGVTSVKCDVLAYTQSTNQVIMFILSLVTTSSGLLGLVNV